MVLGKCKRRSFLELGLTRVRGFLAFQKKAACSGDSNNIQWQQYTGYMVSVFTVWERFIELNYIP